MLRLLTNEEVVGLVGLWLNDRAKDSRPALLEAEEVNTFKRDDLPVTVLEDDTVMYPWWRTKKRFENVDANAATHLARNAFGGADSNSIGAVLSMTSPRHREYRYVFPIIN
jgi:pyruvate dehydrogenase phosphatase